MKTGPSPQLRLALCAAAWGTLGIFVRNIPLSSGEIALYRAVIALFVLIAIQLAGKRPFPLNEIKSNLLPLCLSGAAMGFNWILLFEAYRFTTVSIATLSYYFAPVIVMAVSPLLFRERITLRQLLFFLLATAGLVLVIGVAGGSGAVDHGRGIAYGLGAAALYATVMLINKSIRGVSGLDRTQVQFLVAIAVLVPYVALTSGFRLQALTGMGLVNLLILGMVHTGLCYCVYFATLPTLTGQRVAILSYVDPLVAVLASIVVLRETVTPWQLAGGAMILAGALLNELHQARQS